MKNIYIRPTLLVVRISNESLLASESGQIEYGFSKENDFSSWDYDFDEEDESESNFSSKSLWD